MRDLALVIIFVTTCLSSSLASESPTLNNLTSFGFGPSHKNMGAVQLLSLEKGRERRG